MKATIYFILQTELAIGLYVSSVVYNVPTQKLQDETEEVC